jgi:hypothetical protein
MPENFQNVGKVMYIHVQELFRASKTLYIIVKNARTIDQGILKAARGQHLFSYVDNLIRIASVLSAKTLKARKVRNDIF